MRFCQFWSPSVTVAYCLRNMVESMRGVDGVGDLLLGGPDVAQIDGLAGLVLAQRVGGEVVADVAGERVGDHQRRRHQVICADLGRDSALEVAIAGEHGDRDEEWSSMAFETSVGSGPELPMQVVQP